MEVVRLLFAILFGAALTSGARQDLLRVKYDERQRFVLMPDGEGELHLVDLDNEDREAVLKFDAAQSVKFYLFRQDDIRREIDVGDSQGLNDIKFDANKLIKIIIHGWNSDGASKVNTLLTDAHLRIEDVNVIVVDWSKGANGLYTTAVSNVMTVAVYLASLIDWLVIKEGVPLSNFHLMGHSLGGHMVGMTGRQIISGKLPYVTAMDPAGPLWGSGSPRINPNDAEYVEVIHTDAGFAGLTEPVGHNDFYPNKGSGQPGCFLSLTCSHSRAYEIMADSIDHVGFMAIHCTDHKTMMNGKCEGPIQLHMGGSRPKPAHGVFYLQTNSKQPYFQSPVG